MITVCKENSCTGCMACVEVCNRGAIKIVDDFKNYNAVIEKKKCVECGRCKHVCQNNEKLELKKPLNWKQGWSHKNEIRERAASGGLASSLMEAFIEKKAGYVCGCTFSNGKFEFKIVNNVSSIGCFSGSKYVKSNPQNVYKKIKKLLQVGESVLFVGLPCQVAGLKSYVGEFQKKLYTIDLICHGTPSPKILELYLKEHGIQIDELTDLRFRKKNNFRLYNEYKALTDEDMPDRYLFAFLKSLIYTDNCYDCNFAKEKRISDITLGDSWGSNLSAEEQKKGISLILCQTDKGQELLELSDVHLENVERESAMKHNGQLNAPVEYNPKRNLFFELLEKKKKIDHIIFRLYPNIFVRQYIKLALKKLKIIRGGVPVIRYGLYYKK